MADILNLLIAEDDPATLQLLGDIAESCGWRAHRAHDGAEALALYRAKPFDLVLSDVMMPGVGGFELLAEIRRSAHQCPVVLMTAARGEESPIRAIRMGANDFLVKPFQNLKDVRVLLNRYLHLGSRHHARTRVLQSIASLTVEIELENDVALIGPTVEYITEHLPDYGVRLGLSELIANAMEHGNLDLTGLEKRRALEQTGAVWQQLLEERRQRSPYRERRVYVLFRRNAQFSEWTISDEGVGFDPAAVPDPTAAENLEAPCGRGIYVARQQFDEFEFIDRGNMVRVLKRHG